MPNNNQMTEPPTNMIRPRNLFTSFDTKGRPPLIYRGSPKTATQTKRSAIKTIEVPIIRVAVGDPIRKNTEVPASTMPKPIATSSQAGTVLLKARWGMMSAPTSTMKVPEHVTTAAIAKVLVSIQSQNCARDGGDTECYDKNGY